MPNVSSILIVFCRFFTWIALNDVDLCFSLILVRKDNAVGEEITSHELVSPLQQSIHVTDGMTVTLLTASLLQKKSVAMDRLGQNVLNQKLLHKLKKVV